MTTLTPAKALRLLTPDDLAAMFRKRRGWAHRAAARDRWLAAIGFPAAIAPSRWDPDAVAAWRAARWPKDLPPPQGTDVPANDVGTVTGSPLSEEDIDTAIERFYAGAMPGDRTPAPDQPVQAAE